MEFKNQEEMWRHLLSGGCIRGRSDGQNCYIKFHNGRLSKFKITNDSYICNAMFCFSRPSEWIEYIKKEWYEKIPEQGVLCWVNKEKTKIDVIKGYDPVNKAYRFVNGANHIYMIAIPLTNEEIKKFIHESE